MSLRSTRYPTQSTLRVLTYADIPPPSAINTAVLKPGALLIPSLPSLLFVVSSASFTVRCLIGVTKLADAAISALFVLSCPFPPPFLLVFRRS